MNTKLLLTDTERMVLTESSPKPKIVRIPMLEFIQGENTKQSLLNFNLLKTDNVSFSSPKASNCGSFPLLF